jgi:hypothetical protein
MHAGLAISLLPHMLNKNVEFVLDRQTAIYLFGCSIRTSMRHLMCSFFHLEETIFFKVSNFIVN